jgi:hypothetical protein
LLDTPPEVAHARKREVPLEETVRQSEDYRRLLASLPNGHIVDGAQELDEVVADLRQLLLRHLACRTARRFGREAAQ